jgi:hypothetical protein
MTTKQVFNTSAELDYPTVLPTLDLDFANSKTLDPRITFTRSSGGSYVGADGLIKYAGVNEPRFNHDPVTGESLGLLIEEARTNSLTNSINFTTGWHNQDIASQIASSSFEFYSGNNVIKIIPNTSITNQHAYNFNANPLTTSSGTFSFFAKSDGYRYVWFRSDGASGGTSGGAVFDLLNGVISTTANGTSTIQKYPNNYYRCSFTGFFTAGLALRIGVSINTSFDGYPTTSFSGDGISGILISTPQLELGAFPTSYIPTTTAAVTRAADVARISGANLTSWYNYSEGTFYGEVNFNSTLKNIFSSIIGVNANGNNGILSAAQGTSAYPNKVAAGLVNFNSLNWFPVGKNERFFTKLYRLGSFVGYPAIYDGPYPSLFHLGYNPGNPQYLNGNIKRLTFWPKRFPDAQLKALSTY